MLEVVVVLVIIAILMAIITLSFRGTRATATFRAASAAAVSYSEAIDAYMADNGQVPPALGAAAWPTATRAQRIGGPRDAMLLVGGQPKRYMARAAPEAVSDGLVDIGATMPTTGTAQAFISYSTSGSNYTLRVETTPLANGEVRKCAITNGTTLPTGFPRCT